MKKLFLSAAVALAGVVGVNAQMMESLQVGARAGYNYSNLRGDNTDKLDLKGVSGYHVGLFVEVPVSEKFSIQPEVIYSTQGAKLNTSITLPLTGLKVGDDIEFNLQNINVPVLAKFYVVDGLNIQVGPQFGFSTGSKIKYGDKESDILKEATSKVNFAGVLGAGYKLPMGFTVDARYALGFTNVFDKDNKDLKNLKVGEEFKDGVFSIGVGYQF